METLIRWPSRVMIYLLNKVCFTFMVSESVISCLHPRAVNHFNISYTLSIIRLNIYICMNSQYKLSNFRDSFSTVLDPSCWTTNEYKKPTILMKVGSTQFNFRADVTWEYNYISRGLKLTDNRTVSTRQKLMQDTSRVSWWIRRQSWSLSRRRGGWESVKSVCVVWCYLCSVI